MRAVIPFMRPSHLPKAPPLNAIALGIRISTYEFGGEHIQSITFFPPPRPASPHSPVLVVEDTRAQGQKGWNEVQTTEIF